MPCYIRMKRIFLQGLLWLYLTGLGFLAMSLEPGFLDFDNLPDTNFSCVGKVIGGYYADLETNCQMFHVCTIGQLDEPMDIRFLCLNGTVFDQETRVCERIDEVDCSKSEQFYSLNLELYGNTQPAILEETPETDQPLIIKSSTTTTTTTTSRPKIKTTKGHYFTTPRSATTISNNPQVISTHHFPVANSPDIRFNPEEINISLNPGAPPDIRTKPVSYQPHGYSDNANSNNKKVVVTTHGSLYSDEDDKDEDQVQIHPNNGDGIEKPHVSITTQKPSSVVSYELTHNKNSQHNQQQNPITPADINYSFTYGPTEDDREYHTEHPPHPYQYQTNFRPNFANNLNSHHPFHSSTYRNDYVTTTTTKNNFAQNNKGTTTVKNIYLQSFKPPSHYHFNSHRTEKPHRVQLPLPLLPTLPPLTFSSPAPFTLTRHKETKRYTKDHQAPPRIIISASASVSDASGRRLNYSLGQIGAAHILEQPPKSYDEYKDDDVGLDPFYHDVPKLKHRTRRSAQETKTLKHSDVIKNEQEAVDVLKFLFDWYKSQEKSSTLTIPVAPEVITDINKEFAPNPADAAAAEELDYDFQKSDLFKRKSKFNILGEVDVGNESIKITRDLNEPTNSSLLKEVLENVAKGNQSVGITEGLNEPNNSSLLKEVLEKAAQGNESIEISRGLDEPKNSSLLKEVLGIVDKDEEYQYDEEDFNDKYEPTREKFDAKVPKVIEEDSKINQNNKRRKVTGNEYQNKDIEDLNKQNDTRKNDEIRKNATQEDNNSESIVYQETNNTEPLTKIIEDNFKKDVIENKPEPSNPKEEVKDELFQHEEDYVNDNYEPLVYQEPSSSTQPLLLEDNKTGSKAVPSNSENNYETFESVTEALIPEIEKIFEDKKDNETGVVLPIKEIFEPITSKEVEVAKEVVTEVYSSSSETPSTVVLSLTNSTEESTTLLQTSESYEPLTLVSSTTTERSRRRGGNRSSYRKQSSTTTRKPTRRRKISRHRGRTFDSQNHNSTTSTTSSTTETAVTPNSSARGKSRFLKLAAIERNLAEEVNTQKPEIVDTTQTTPFSSFENVDIHVTPYTSSTESIEVESTTESGKLETIDGSNARKDEDYFTELQSKYEHNTVKKQQAGVAEAISGVVNVTEVGSTTESVNKESNELVDKTESSLVLTTEEVTDKIELTTASTTTEGFVTTPVVSTVLVEEPTEEIISGTTTEFTFGWFTAPLHITKVKTSTTESTPKLEASTVNKIREIDTITTTVENFEEDVVTTTTEDVTTEVVTDLSVPEAFTTTTEAFTSLDDSNRIIANTKDYPEKVTTESLKKFVEEIEASTKSVAMTSVNELEVEKVVDLTTQPEIESTSQSITTTTAEILNTTVSEETTVGTSTTTIGNGRRFSVRNRPPTQSSRRKPSYNYSQRKASRHRFSTEWFTPRPSHGTTSTTTTNKPEVEEKIPHFTLTDSPKAEEEVSTDAPLFKSVNPTLAETVKDSTQTTPLSTTVSRGESYFRKIYRFNCFGKEIHKFYPDPRDCRLFHYCTQGYNRNQLLDMKFVCDSSTYFDDEKLICTKVKPVRCL